MAVVDFSNAVIECTGEKFWEYSFLGFTYNGAQLYHVPASGNVYVIVSDYHYTKMKETKTECVWLYTGKFTQAGTAFWFGVNNQMPWKVSNISFQAGDTYAFEIVLTRNT